MMSSRPHEIEGDDEKPKERAYPCREKRQNGQHSGREVTVGGESGEAGGQIGADDARKDKDQPEEAKAVQCGDGALGIEPVHRLEPGQNVRAEAEQARDIAENEMQLER